MCVLGFNMNAPIHYLCRDGSLQGEGAWSQGGSGYRRRGGLLRVCEETSAGYRASDWKLVDERITELGVERAAHEHEVCRRLLDAERLGVAARVGFASLRDYSKRRLGLNGRQTEERLRVGRALAGLPALDEALSAGALCWSAVRELSRVAVAETEQAWREWASGKTSRQVEKAVGTRQPGDLPSSRPDPALIQHRLSFNVRAETMALFRELSAAIRSELGGVLDEDLMLHEIARRALGGVDDGGRAPYQVTVTHCETCAQTAIDAGGESHPVDAVVEGMIACDAQILPPVGTAKTRGGAEAKAHVGAKSRRATQTVPPATRRSVLRRTNACAVPGCRNHRHLHVHHVVPRSEGGGHDPALLTSLCHRHHSAIHAGTLVISGDTDRGFVFGHADGAAYGRPLNPAAVDLAKRAFDTLRGLGFKMTQARQRIDAVQRAGAPASLQGFVQAALRLA